jgi:hypothetical protein
VIINDEAAGIKKSDVTFELVKEAGLVLRQVYFPEKRRANRTQFISWGSGDLRHPTYCITIPLVDV